MPAGLEDVRIPMPDEEGPKKALVIAAHPDDSEFGAAGTVCQWVKEGWEVYYLICTDGSKGRRPGVDARQACSHPAR